MACRLQFVWNNHKLFQTASDSQGFGKKKQLRNSVIILNSCVCVGEIHDGKGLTWAPEGHATCLLQSGCGGSRPGLAGLFFALKQGGNDKNIKNEKTNRKILELLVK